MSTLAKALKSLLSEALKTHRNVQLRDLDDGTTHVRLTPLDSTEAPIDLQAEEWQSTIRDSHPNNKHHLWILPNVPNRIPKELRAKRESFVDVLRGTVYLDLPHLLVDRMVRATKRPNKARETAASLTRPLVDPFADRASLLVRTLLESPGATWTVTGLAEAAGVASMVSSHIVRQLAAAQIVETEKLGRRLLVRLIAPRALMEAWVARYDWRRNTAFALAAPVGDEERFLHRFSILMKEKRWALTLLAAAWRRMKYSPPDRLHVYVDVESDARLKEFSSELGWAPDQSGKLVLLRPAYRTSVWHKVQTVRDIPVVSDVQLIVDLWHYPVRGRETAEQMFSRIEHAFDRTSSNKTG